MAGITNIGGVDVITKIDEAQTTPTNITYVGRAKIGMTASDTGWKILRIERSGTETTISYAEGSQSFNKVWDDREAYTYS